jgi:hypothetical protein
MLKKKHKVRMMKANNKKKKLKKSVIQLKKKQTDTNDMTKRFQKQKNIQNMKECRDKAEDELTEIEEKFNQLQLQKQLTLILKMLVDERTSRVELESEVAEVSSVVSIS